MKNILHLDKKIRGGGPTSIVTQNRVLVDNVEMGQLKKEFPAFYGKRTITVVSHHAVTESHPETNEFSPHPSTIFT